MKQGDIVGLKYRILRKLGQGGTSNVFLAENMLLSNLWAIKVISKHDAALPEELREINVLKNLNHPMLPRIADLFEDDEKTYIVMDYIKGETLSHALSQAGSFDENRIIEFIKSLCDVLSYLHQQKPTPVIYRDLKPSNIILDENGRLHLIDFGTARAFKEDRTEDTVYIGTYGYAAPEQFGTGQSDERTDLFNLGMTIIHLATGIHPASLHMDNVTDYLKQKGVSEGLAAIIKDLIHVEPDKRISNVQECLRLVSNLGQRSPPDKRAFRSFPRNMKLKVSLMGIEHGAGTTLAGLTLAVSLAGKGYQTAFVEMNNSGDINRLENAFNRGSKAMRSSQDQFSAHGITFYKGVSNAAYLPKSKYEIIIYDMGCLHKESSFQEFNRADVRLVICPGMDWKHEKASDFKNAYGYLDPHEEWIYVFSPSGPTDEKSLQKLLQIKNILGLPLISELFKPGRTEKRQRDKAMEKIFKLAGLTGIID